MNSEKKGAAIGKALLSGPYLIWMAGFTLIPLAMIIWYGLTDKGGGLTMANVIAIASADHAKALWLSLGLSLVSTVLCLLLAYPLAMILRGRGAAAGGFIVFIFILPMWMNFLLRTLAWQTLLEKNGVINGILNWLHLPSQSMINTPSAIVLGMVYNFLPFMVLPMYNVLSKIDDNIINAAMDLGANSFQRFTRIWFPLSIPGIISGITMTPTLAAENMTLAMGTPLAMLFLEPQKTMGISSALPKPRRRLIQTFHPSTSASKTQLSSTILARSYQPTWCQIPCTTASLKAT
mgnify:CR=1 FL=1